MWFYFILGAIGLYLGVSAGFNGSETNARVLNSIRENDAEMTADSSVRIAKSLRRMYRIDPSLFPAVPTPAGFAVIPDSLVQAANLGGARVPTNIEYRLLADGNVIGRVVSDPLSDFNAMRYTGSVLRMTDDPEIDSGMAPAVRTIPIALHQPVNVRGSTIDTDGTGLGSGVDQDNRVTVTDPGTSTGIVIDTGAIPHVTVDPGADTTITDPLVVIPFPEDPGDPDLPDDDIDLGDDDLELPVIDFEPVAGREYLFMDDPDNPAYSSERLFDESAQMLSVFNSDRQDAANYADMVSEFENERTAVLEEKYRVGIEQVTADLSDAETSLATTLDSLSSLLLEEQAGDVSVRDAILDDALNSDSDVPPEGLSDAALALYAEVRALRSEVDHLEADLDSAETALEKVAEQVAEEVHLIETQAHDLARYSTDIYTARKDATDPETIGANYLAGNDPSLFKISDQEDALRHDDAFMTSSTPATLYFATILKSIAAFKTAVLTYPTN